MGTHNVNKFTFKDKYKYEIGRDFKLTYCGEDFNCKVVSCIPCEDGLNEITVHLPEGHYIVINDQNSYYEVIGA